VNHPCRVRTSALVAEGMLPSALAHPQACRSRIPKSAYNDCMGVYVINNPVPTPEKMGKILGVSSERVEAVRRIMATPVRRKTSGRSSKTVAIAASKLRSSGRRNPARAAKKR
jgi:hypothetical protein